MRLIDADVLFKQIQHAEIEAPDLVCKAWVMADVASMIHNSPTIYAEPIRHGRWEKVQVWKDNPHTTLKCTACKTWQPIYEHDNWDYCPFCGAKMDAEVEE